MTSKDAIKKCYSDGWKVAEKKKGKMTNLTLKRADGLQVFFDGDTADKRTVIVAVALRRAQQIARNYARKYAPEILTDFETGRLQIEGGVK